MDVSLSYTACSSDEPTPGTPSTPSENPEDNLPEASKAFVGYWLNQGNSGSDFLFFEDGACWMFPKSNNPDYSYYHSEEGYWTFNPTTSILATTTGLWQWTVTLSNTEAWTGITVNTGSASSFKHRDKIDYIKAILNQSTWNDAEDQLSIRGCDYYSHRLNSYETYDFYAFPVSGNFKVCYYDISEDVLYLEILEDDNLDDYTFEYKFRSNKYTSTYVETSNGTITLKNPTSSTKQQLVFSGDLDKTFSRSITD